MQTLLNQVPGAQYINNLLVGDASTPPGTVSISAPMKSATTPPGVSIMTSIPPTPSAFPSRGTAITQTGPTPKTIIRSFPKSAIPPAPNFFPPRGVDAVAAAHQRAPRRFQPDLGYFNSSQRLAHTCSPEKSSPIRSMSFCRKAAIPIPSPSPTTRLISAATTISSFGFHGQQIRVRSVDFSGPSLPIRSLWGTGQPALTTRDLPGISQTDLPTPINCWPRWAATWMATARRSTSPALLRASCPARHICGISRSPICLLHTG